MVKYSKPTDTPEDPAGSGLCDLLIQGQFLKAILVFVLAGLTDALDGFLARVLHQKTDLGLYLDPLGDKALIVTFLCYPFCHGPDPAVAFRARHQQGFHYSSGHLRHDAHVHPLEIKPRRGEQGPPPPSSF